VVDEVLAYKGASDPQHFAVVNSEHELEIMKLYYRGRLPPRKAKCYAGWKELYINADGRAIMCDGHLDFLNGQFGDVRAQTLQELWESDALRARREVVKACESPCIQDCYLREQSDSLIDIAKEAGGKLLRELKKRLPARPGQWVPLPGSQLTLELSDVSDVNPAHDAARSAERLEQLTVKLPVPFERCYDDPFEYYEMRNRGYLNFNRGFMGFELVKRLVPDLERAGVRFEQLRLGFRGDPLLHPEFVPVYRYLLEHAQSMGVFAEVRVDTFATLLNTEYVDLAIASAVPQVFHVQIDAATPETYLAVNGKDLFKTVLERIDYLLAMKARHRAHHVRLVPVFSALPANELEAVAFRELWRARITGHGLEPPSVAAGELPGRVPGEHAPDMIFFRRKDDDNFLEQLKSREALARVAAALGIPDVVIDRDLGRAPRCAAPFKTPTVTWDGKVTVCDQDRFLRLKVGEVTTEDLAEIWWKKGTSREVREAVERGELHQRMPCRDCRQPFSPNAPTITDEELARYGRMSGHRGWSV
jgi:radical SAM protein with 4Fe4S-binding SPASM domain